MSIGAVFAWCCRATQAIALGGFLFALLGAPPGASAAPPPTGAAAPVTPLAAAPPMGWDSWDSFGCRVNEQDVEQAARWLVATGLRDAGYRYVIIDDCWYDPTRGADGSLRANPTRFPTGMRWLGWYLHSHGLLFGIYESASQTTCAQLNGLYPGSTGSLGHEQQDARTFAAWGVDYVKYDWCSTQGSIWDQFAEFTKIRNALRATGRPIVYSINPNSFHSTTGPRSNWSSVANLVRTSQDLAPVWDMGSLRNWYVGVVNGIADDARLGGRAGPGHWNDPDALVVGMHGAPYADAVNSPSLGALLRSPPAGVDASLSFEEMRTNFAMWAMMAAPLILGDDIRALGPGLRQIVLNPGLIAIDQDPLGRQAEPLWPDTQVWVKPLSNRAIAVAFFNSTNAAAFISTDVSKRGLPKTSRYAVTDLWSGRDFVIGGALWAKVPAHGVALFRVTPVLGKSASPSKKAPVASGGTGGASPHH